MVYAILPPSMSMSNQCVHRQELDCLSA